MSVSANQRTSSSEPERAASSSGDRPSLLSHIIWRAGLSTSGDGTRVARHLTTATRLIVAASSIPTPTYVPCSSELPPPFVASQWATSSWFSRTAWRRGGK